MIIKPLSKSHRLIQHEALSRRLNPKHAAFEQIQQHTRSLKAGFAGEASINYYLQFLPKDCLILQQVNLQNSSGYSFQIDLLICSPKFFLIAEVKNYAGQLFFDTHYSQLVRTFEDQEQVFPCPLLQSKRQSQQLAEWLRERGFSAVPIYTHVLISNPKTHITATEKIANVSHAAKLGEAVHQLQKETRSKKISETLLHTIAAAINDAHNEKRMDIIQYYQITQHDLDFELECTSCKKRALTYNRKKWRCSDCHANSHQLHQPMLKDYYLLFPRNYSMKELSILLKIPTVKAANSLLRPLLHKTSASNKGAVYQLDWSAFNEN